jgi:hypothetical protein
MNSGIIFLWKFCIHLWNYVLEDQNILFVAKLIQVNYIEDSIFTAMGSFEWRTPHCYWNIQVKKVGCKDPPELQKPKILFHI